MWNHRIVKRSETWYELSEVYYDSNRRPYSFNAADAMWAPGDEGSPTESIRKQLHWMLDATHLPILTWPDDFNGEKP